MNRRIGLLLPLLLGVQCTGTETENPLAPLVSFHASDCKKELTVGSKSLPAPDSGPLRNVTSKQVSFDSSYDGLQCISWQKLEGGAVRFDLGNFHEGCGVDWQGSASITADGKVALNAINAECAVARCGWCMYDWGFDVRGVPEGKDATLQVTVVDDAGEHCPNATAPYEITLPTSSAAQGLLCRPAFRSAVEWQANALGTNGGLNMPCDPATASSCSAELSCGPLASTDDLRCLARCSADSDCPLPEVLSCIEGTCRLTQTW
ncbi:MAG TPA: hypothetical protein VFK05_02880 [Polyangiaceae bacterium]|nr:hypothetical protein [Polyangiaceae bacterium]